MPAKNAHQEVLCISDDHPSLPGHFPGKPIVPGVVILTSVFESIGRANPHWEITGLRKLKFLQPLSPGQGFCVEQSEIDNNGLRFKCYFSDSDTLLAEGHLKLRQHSEK